MITGFSPTPFWVPPPAPVQPGGTMRIATDFPAVQQIPLGINPAWWPINAAQQAILQSPAEMLLGGGSSGFGKSEILPADAMQEYWLPTMRGLLLRESLGEMDQLSDRMKVMYEPLGASYRNRSGGGEWEFPIYDERTRKPLRRKGGARIRYGYLAKDSDIGRYRGNPKSWLGIDESGLQPVKRVRTMIPWLASTDKRLRVRARFASNPGGVGASWQMAVFLRNRCPLHYPAVPGDIDPKRSVVPGKVYSGASWSWPPSQSELIHMTTAFFPASIFDNPLYDQSKIDKLRSQTPEIQMQLLYGCWCNAESLYFGFMNPERQCPRQLVRDEWWMNHVISIDYGFKNSSAAAGLFVTQDSGQTFGIDEAVERQMGAVDFAKMIAEKWIKPKLGEHPRRIEFVVMDPATDSHDDVGKSKYELMAEVFAEYGIPSVKAHKDSEDNAQNLYQGLASNMLVLTSGMPQTFTSISTRVIDDRRAVLKVHGDPLDDFYDKCLEAGTMVATERGQVPIEDVTIQDKVWTRNGLRSVLWSGITNEDAELWDVEFSNGAELSGTAAHPVFVEGKGFVRLDKLAYADNIVTCQDKYLYALKSLSIEGSLLGDTRTLQNGITAVTTAPDTTTAEPESMTYTEKYINVRLGQSQMGMPSTTETTTQTATTRATSNSCLDQTICGCTWLSGWLQMKGLRALVSTSLLSGHFRRRGIVLQKALNGIARISLKRANACLPRSTYAIAVERSSRDQACRKENTVAQIAQPRLAEIRDLITSKDRARSAEDLSLVTSTSHKNAVPVVVISCSIGRRGRVYNLSVEDDEEFFANGILVHNCTYFWNTFLRESKKPERLKLQEALDRMRAAGADPTALARRNMMAMKQIEDKERQQAQGLSLRRR